MNFTKKGLFLRKYEFEEFERDIKELTQKLACFEADAIVFVARGGATMAHFLALNLDIRKIYSINAVSYEGQTKIGTPAIEEAPNLSLIRKALVVDEIVDTGETLQAVLKKLQDAYPDKEFKSVSLFQRERAVIKADVYLHLTSEWVWFFWEI